MDIKRPDLKQKRKRKQLIGVVSGTAVMAVLMIILFRLEPAAPKVERSTVWIDRVQRGEFVRQVRGPGTLVPKEIRLIAATSEGRVERVLVKAGARVEPDTVLVELSNPELVRQAEEAGWSGEAAEADLRSLEAELSRELLDARAGLAVVKADQQGAQLQMEAEADLVKQGIVSRLQFRQSELRAQQLEIRVGLEQQRIQELGASIQAQLAAQQARVEQVRRLKQRREQQVADLQVRAGIAGVLQIVNVEPGEQLAPGFNVARVAQPEELIAELRVAETQARDIQMDQKVEVDTRNGVVEGRVIRIDPAVLNGTVQVDVELIGQLPSGVRPDLSVDGVIELERLEDVLYVGRPAYGQSNSTVSLFRLDGDGNALRSPVSLGRASVNLIEVVAGLQAGDQVILSDTSAWDEHDRIRLE